MAGLKEDLLDKAREGLNAIQDVYLDPQVTIA